jgi:hypothetical protein
VLPYRARGCANTPSLFDECRIRGDDVIIADQPWMAGKSDYYPKTPMSQGTILG